MAMRQNGGYATLSHLYLAAPRVPQSQWGTKTPFASIRRIVQTRPQFFRIRPGLWGLAEQRHDILRSLNIASTSNRDDILDFDHTYYQGLAVEIGAFRGFETRVPNQDSGKLFLNRRLRDVATLEQCHDFSYPNLVQRAKGVDVLWFNQRKMPSAFIEIEFTTDFYNSLLKFCDLQDFRARFLIVSDMARKREYDQKLACAAFADIRQLVTFVDFEQIASLHSHLAQANVQAI